MQLGILVGSEMKQVDMTLKSNLLYIYLLDLSNCKLTSLARSQSFEVLPHPRMVPLLWSSTSIGSVGHGKQAGDTKISIAPVES